MSAPQPFQDGAVMIYQREDGVWIQIILLGES